MSDEIILHIKGLSKGYWQLYDNISKRKYKLSALDLSDAFNERITRHLNAFKEYMDLNELWDKEE